MWLSVDLCVKGGAMSKRKASALLSHHLEPCGCQMVTSLSLKNPLLLLLLLGTNYTMHARQSVSDELMLELQGLYVCL